MMAFHRNKALLFFLLLIAASLHSFAQVNESGANFIYKDFFIELNPEKSGSIYPTEQLTLNIDVYSQQEFAGAFSIEPIDVPGLIVMQRESFSTYFTDRKQAKNWNVQRRSLQLYSQSVSNYTIDFVMVEVKFRDADGKTVSRVLKSGPLRITVKPFPETEGQEIVLAAPEFKLSSQLDKTQLEQLALGDAMKWTFNFTASDTVAMLLPELELPKFQGMALYARPIDTEDSHYRGVYQATKQVSFDLLAEETGTYIFPEQTIHWLNLESKTIETLVIEETKMVVGGDATIKRLQLTPQQLAEKEKQFRQMIEKLVAIVLIFALLSAWFAIWWKRTLVRRRLKKILALAANAPNDEKGLQQLYSFMANQSANDEKQLQKYIASIDEQQAELARSLLALTYSRSPASTKSQRKRLASFLKKHLGSLKGKKKLRVRSELF